MSAPNYIYIYLSIFALKVPRILLLLGSFMDYFIDYFIGASNAVSMHCVSPRLAFPALGSVWYAAHGGASRWTYEARGTGIDTSRGSSWIPAGGLDE